MIELTATHLQHLPPDIVEDLEGRGRFEDIYADSTVRMVRGVCCLLDEGGGREYFYRGFRFVRDEDATYCPWTLGWGSGARTFETMADMKMVIDDKFHGPPRPPRPHDADAATRWLIGKAGR